MAQLRRAQQRRRNIRRGGVAGAIVLAALILALFSGGVFGGGHKKVKVSSATTTTTAKKSSSTTAPSTTAPSSSTTVPISSLKPLPPAKLDAALIARKAPPISPACNAKPSKPTTTTTTAAKGNAVSIVPAPAKVPFPKLNGTSPRYTKFSSPPPFCINVNKTYTAHILTDVGSVTVHLLPKYAPLTVNNFVFLAGYHFFDGTVFHRVIQGFVDQGGDPTGTGSGGPGYTIADEYPKSKAAYDAGALAMANTGAPHTGGSQFFFVVGNGGQGLTPSYSMFGQVTKGLSVIDKINAGGSPPTSSTGTPKVLHKIEKVTITES